MVVLKSAGLWLLMAVALFLSARFPMSFSPPALSAQKAHQLREELLREKSEGRYQEALFIARKLLRAFPQDSVYLNWLAEIYHELKDFDAEARAYELSLSLSPTPTESCPAIGRAYFLQGRLEDALDADSRCLAFEPSNVDLQLYRGLSLERLGRLAQARQDFLAILEITPQYTDAILGLARLELAEGRPGAAAVRLRTVPLKDRRRPDVIEAHARLRQHAEEQR